MAERTFFGEYNNIYFVQEEGKIKAIWDRPHRKRQVPFVEDLIDLASETSREPADIYMEGQSPPTGSWWELYARERGKDAFPYRFREGT